MNFREAHTANRVPRSTGAMSLVGIGWCLVRSVATDWPSVAANLRPWQMWASKSLKQEPAQMRSASVHSALDTPGGIYGPYGRLLANQFDWATLGTAIGLWSASKRGPRKPISTRMARKGTRDRQCYQRSLAPQRTWPVDVS